MVFIIKKLKYDTDKMKLISDRCSYSYEDKSFGCIFRYNGRNVKLWESNKGNWLLTYETDYAVCGKAVTENEAGDLLLKYDVERYEEIFGKLEEA